MIIYTASDKGDMLKNLEKSIKSLRKYYKDEIIVFLTPPLPNYLFMNNLENNYGVCLNISNVNYTKPFRLKEGGRYGRYGEKIIAISKTKNDNVMFLDCDTIINSNPDVLFNYDFDFSARVAPSFLNVNFNEWVKPFYENDCCVLPIFNAGCLVFKNKTNEFVGELAIKYFDDGKKIFSRDIGKQYQLDQFSISLAVSKLELNIKYMGESEHGYRWMYDNPKSIIYHGSKNNIIKEFYRIFRGGYRYIS